MLANWKRRSCCTHTLRWSGLATKPQTIQQMAGQVYSHLAWNILLNPESSAARHLRLQ